MLALLAPFRTEIIIGALVAILAGAGYFYFTYSQNKIVALEKLQAQEELRISAFVTTIDQMKIDAAETRKHQDELDASLSTIRTHTETQKSAIDAADIDKQAQKDAAALEKSLNADTAKTLKSFEDSTK